MPNTFAITRNRREFLRDAFCGFGSLALASMLHGEQARSGRIRSPPKPPHCRRKAKSVIFLFMAGGPSHLETFDPKPLLNKLDGQKRPGGVRRGEVSVRRQRRQAARHQAHVSASTARAASKSPTCFRTRPSASTTSRSSAPATATWWSTRPRSIELFSGRIVPGFPSMGSWVVYGLGSESRVAAGLRRDARSRRRARSGPADVHATAFCRRSISRRMFRPGAKPVRNLDLPPGVSLRQRRKTVELIRELNEADADAGRRRVRRPHRAPTIWPSRCRPKRRRSSTCPARRRKRSTCTASASEPTDDYGRRCLLARRLVEQGVRFAVRRLRRRARQHAVGRPRRHRREPPAHGRARPTSRSRPAQRSEAARPARFDAGALGRRVRPLARSARRQGPRPPQPRLHDVAGRRRHQGRPGRRRHRRHRPASRREAATTSATSTPRSCTSSASTKTN